MIDSLEPLLIFKSRTSRSGQVVRLGLKEADRLRRGFTQTEELVRLCRVDPRQ